VWWRSTKKKSLRELKLGCVPSKPKLFEGISSGWSEAKVHLVIEKWRNNHENSRVCCGFKLYPTLPVAWCSMLRSENADSPAAGVIGEAWAVGLGIIDVGGT
jgi:hypothetical protein